MRFSRSFCLLLTEIFLSIRTKLSVRSLPLCQILQTFTVNFQRCFRSKYKFCKIFEGTRSLNLHLREPGVLARARAISGPGRARQETISSHLNLSLHDTDQNRSYFAFHSAWSLGTNHVFLQQSSLGLIPCHVLSVEQNGCRRCKTQ